MTKCALGGKNCARPHQSTRTKCLELSRSTDGYAAFDHRWMICCRIERKKLKKLEIKIAVYTSPSKDKMPICVPFSFSFRGLKTIFQPQNVFTLYKFSVYNVQFICHLVFTSLFKAQKQFTSTGLKECQTAEPLKEESKLPQKNIEGKKSKQSILQNARLSFQKTPSCCH